ncbi:MAG: DUF3086 domain-containing protein [Cyanobacteria bacterium J06598_1]
MPPEDSTPYEDTDATDSGAADKPSASASSRSASSDTPLGLRRSDRNRAGIGASASGASPSGPSSSGSSSGLGSSFSARSSSSSAASIDQLVQKALQDLERQRRDLQREIEQLERRKERLEGEMRSSFAGSSQEIAIRVQGFKDYLIGSLQDLATAAEQINLVSQPTVEAPVPEPVSRSSEPVSDDFGGMVPFAAQRFAQQRDRIHSLLDQYRTRPDYYGPPWQLRRTFEPIHAERVSNWFFTQGGRGSVKSVGSRLQNVLVASAAISCLYAIYDRRMCVLVLATTPERLGEWRRWLQDCLGVARSDFGTNRGIMLFESSEPMAQRAERLLDSGRLPFLIMDEAEEKVSLSLLQYPLWLGFARDPENPSGDYDYY